MRTELKSFLVWIALVFLFSLTARADSNGHDFKKLTWSKGRSCAICHVIKRGVMAPLPQGARPYNSPLSQAETLAVSLHPSNRLCFVCHQSANDQHSPTELDPNSGNLPGAPTPTLPPSTGRGTVGSICIRVNNQGAKGEDCLECHDVHNLHSDQLLRMDYGQTPTP